MGLPAKGAISIISLPILPQQDDASSALISSGVVRVAACETPTNMRSRSIAPT